MYLYREGYSTEWKAIGIDTYRHIIGNSIVQKSPGLRDIATLSGGVCGALVTLLLVLLLVSSLRLQKNAS